MKWFSILTIGIILAMILPLTGCSRTDQIADIKANPSQYEGRTVNIEGYVSNTLWIALAGRGAYQVDDGSGSIWVVTGQQPPEKGTQIAATGTVSPGFELGGSGLGTVINETRRG